ncbi:MAG TPA: PHB depolymerase family esterase [Coleofasciculaceae cyanobacterium]
MKTPLNSRIFRQILVSLLSITLVTACASLQAQERSLPKQQTSYGDDYGKLNDQGHLRTYYLYTPKSYNSDRPMPLVFVFHGHGGSGHSIAEVTRFNDLAEQKGFIVVYPDGINHDWTLRGSSRRNIDDVSFVTALLDHLKQSRKIDSHRIYATGFSKGAILAQDLACELPDQFAAFASVAGSLPTRIIPTCKATTPVSMLMINGTNDLSVHYEGDAKNLSIPKTVDFWRSHDQCPSSAQVQQLPDPNPRDRFKVNISRYPDCRDSSEVMLAAVVNGGHFWPGSVSQDESIKQFNTNLAFNASQMIWEFFNRHSLP